LNTYGGEKENKRNLILEIDRRGYKDIR